MRNYHNIESKKLAAHHDYYVGYRKSDGAAIRIFGVSGDWVCNCRNFRTLAQVSAYLETI